MSPMLHAHGCYAALSLTSADTIVYMSLLCTYNVDQHAFLNFEIDCHSRFGFYDTISLAPPLRHGLTRGAIAGVVVGTIMVALVVASLSYAMWRWRRRTMQRKREMIINPQMSRRSRMSLVFSQRPEDALEPFEREHSVKSEPVGVLHISRGKDFDLGDVNEHDEGVEAHGTWKSKKGDVSPISVRQPSQNSDGSFNIELPEMPPAHLSRPRTQPPAPIEPPLQEALRRSSAPSGSGPTSPRSPKPRGPREMQGRESTRGILLSQILPEDVRNEEDALNPHYLPIPVVSPLRVEFAHEEKPERTDRTERLGADEENRLSLGALSLPRSLQRALMRSADLENPPIGGTPVTSFAEQGNPSESGYSFLDLSSSPNLSSLSETASKRSSRSKRTSMSEQSSRDAAFAS